MRIGVDARLWNETGVGRYIRNLVTELLKIDIKNEYVLFVKEDSEKEISRQFTGNRNLHIVTTTIHWHSIREQIQFADLLTKENLDLVHFPYFSLPIRYNKPFVVTIHDLIIHHFPTGKASTLPLPLYYAKRLAFKHVLKHAVNKSQKIIVPLHAVKDDLLKTFHVSPEKVEVTYEGVDSAVSNQQSAFSRQNLSTENYFLYVGNAYPHKNVEGLIAGFSFYKKKHQGPQKLFLVGKEDYFYTRLKKTPEITGNKDIQFFHNVTDEELSRLYSQAQGFISASFMEGFGLPPLEALGNGCLPILSDIPSFREVCQENALYFNPRDPEDIGKTLYMSTTLPEKKRELLITNGAKRVSQFSWKHMAKETLSLYETAL